MIKSYFEKYTSNTLAGSSNQFFFDLQEKEIKTGRIFYKIFYEGEYNYSFLFSNIIDSTYADGTKSWKNLHCGEWKIVNAKVGIGKITARDKDIAELVLSEVDESSDVFVSNFQPLYFKGKQEKKVEVGEVFCSDPIKLRFGKREYLCLELTFSGKRIPYHEEIVIPTFIKNGNEWTYSRCMPIPNMIGCDRKVNERIVFLGDSITQGIGVKENSYLHWNALLSEKIGANYAFWNLGIGYGRASDVASDGVWLKKAMQNDTVFVCLGVNDLCQGRNAIQLKTDLKTVANKLKEAGKKVVIQTIPPFNYNEQVREEWAEVNRFIKEELSQTVDFVFDVVPVLSESETVPYRAKFGGHPNEEGCALWAETLYKKLTEKPVVE